MESFNDFSVVTEKIRNEIMTLVSEYQRSGFLLLLLLLKQNAYSKMTHCYISPGYLLRNEAEYTRSQ